MRCITTACVFAAAVLAGSVGAQDQREWQLLFNGEDLAGWVSSGADDAWGVVDGEIVTIKPGTGGWLRTDRMFRDFEITLEFFMPKGGNSGLGLRGSSGGDPAFTGFELQMLDTHGEEPGLRNCGALYEAVAPLRMSVAKPGNWNTYRVLLIGDTLNVWLNNEPIHIDTKLDDRGFFRKESQPLPLDARATTGYIAFQDHGHAFRFRNIKLRDLSPNPEPKGMTPLINDDLSGWYSEGDTNWAIEHSAIVGRDGPGHLYSDGIYTNFEMRALVKINANGNSGMYFRTVPNPDSTWPIGYEAQVDNHDPKNFTGSVYDKAWTEHSAPLTRDNAWFDYIIRAEGNHIRTWINGVAMVDAQLDEYDEGRFALQGHHPGNVISYKDIRVLELED
ncbi:MAG: hypothetical protein COB69_05320 [Phycisphaera sp.]|nr:MAG: hypothetical protein COB69_05320 [Phycisphaera sp.]